MGALLGQVRQAYRVAPCPSISAFCMPGLLFITPPCTWTVRNDHKLTYSKFSASHQ